MKTQETEGDTEQGGHEIEHEKTRGFIDIFPWSSVTLFVSSMFRILRRSIPGLVAGVLGSLAAIIVMGALRLTWGTPTLPELVGERVLPLMPASQFVDLLVRFAPNSKTGPLGLALLGQFVLGALLGPAYALAADAYLSRVQNQRLPDRRALIAAGGFALGMELVGIAVFWPVLGEGLAGDTVESARLLTMLAMLIIFLSFAIVTLAANHLLVRAWGQWTEPKAAVMVTQTRQTE
ncbi:MAG TPA: hypothetical protein VKB76_01820, partial [Ktedonobacterales bacterium]|nr:hypothetical protein [Ktedonobacterales bacterium]